MDKKLTAVASHDHLAYQARPHAKQIDLDVCVAPDSMIVPCPRHATMSEAPEHPSNAASAAPDGVHPDPKNSDTVMMSQIQ